MNTPINPRILWASVYIFSNIIAYIIIIDSGNLIGDGEQVSVTDYGILFFSILLICSSIFLVCSYFCFLDKCKFPSKVLEIRPALLSIFLISYTSIFIIYVFSTGLFVAGSSERAGSIFSALFVLFNVDILFVLYFATCRNSKYYKYVMAIWLLSALQRGWFAYLFVIFGLESFRFLRSGKIRPWHIIVIILLVVSYPLIDALKIYIRISDGFDLYDFLNMASSLISENGGSLLQASSGALDKIVGRVQTVSHAYMILENEFYFDFASRNIQLNPFWKEGIFGLIYDSMSGTTRLKDVPQLLALNIAPSLESSWNVNPSLVGWIYIYGDFIIFVLMYLLLASLLSYAIVSLLSDDILAFDTLWFIWIIYLLPGWIAQFAGFLFGAIVFIILNVFLNTLADILAAGREALSGVGKAEPLPLPPHPL